MPKDGLKGKNAAGQGMAPVCVVHERVSLLLSTFEKIRREACAFHIGRLSDARTVGLVF